MFETPSVLRESLPSYSAKPGAFYAPRALRWTTPPRGRTDPFQGPKIKLMFHRCSMLFQDDFGVENGGQNGGKIDVKSSPGAFRDAPGARLPGDAVWGCILEVFWDPPSPENRAPATMRAQFRLNTLTAPGGPKSTPSWSKIEAKSLPGAVQMASKAVFNTAAISVLISIFFFELLTPPGGTLLVHLGVHLGPFAAFG